MASSSLTDIESKINEVRDRLANLSLSINTDGPLALPVTADASAGETTSILVDRDINESSELAKPTGGLSRLVELAKREADQRESEQRRQRQMDSQGAGNDTSVATVSEMNGSKGHIYYDPEPGALPLPPRSRTTISHTVPQIARGTAIVTEKPPALPITVSESNFDPFKVVQARLREKFMRNAKPVSPPSSTGGDEVSDSPSAQKEAQPSQQDKQQCGSHEVKHSQQWGSHDAQHFQQRDSPDAKHSQQREFYDAKHPQQWGSYAAEHPMQRGSHDAEHPMQRGSRGSEHFPQRGSSNAEYSKQREFYDAKHSQQWGSYAAEHPMQRGSHDAEHPMQRGSHDAEHPMQRGSHDAEHPLQWGSHGSEHFPQRGSSDAKYSKQPGSSNAKYSKQRDSRNAEHSQQWGSSSAKHSQQRGSRDTKQPLQRGSSTAKHPLQREQSRCWRHQQDPRQSAPQHSRTAAPSSSGRVSAQAPRPASAARDSSARGGTPGRGGSSRGSTASAERCRPGARRPSAVRSPCGSRSSSPCSGPQPALPARTAPNRTVLDVLSGAEVFALMRLRGVLVSRGDTGEYALPETRCHSMYLSADEHRQLVDLRATIRRAPAQTKNATDPRGKPVVQQKRRAPLWT